MECRQSSAWGLEPANFRRPTDLKPPTSLTIVTVFIPARSEISTERAVRTTTDRAKIFLTVWQRLLLLVRMKEIIDHLRHRRRNARHRLQIRQPGA